MNGFFAMAFLVACGGGNGEIDFGSCLAQGSAGAQACGDCTQSSCASQVSTVNGACQAYVACECPNGAPGSAGSDSCEFQIGSGSCLSDLYALIDCEHTTCVAECGSASD
jgi:hypothetical protein